MVFSENAGLMTLTHLRLAVGNRIPTFCFLYLHNNDTARKLTLRTDSETNGRVAFELIVLCAFAYKHIHEKKMNL